MPRRLEVDDRGIPIRCGTCKKRVLDGDGNQEMLKDRVDRYCDRCWKRHSEQAPAQGRRRA